MKTLRELVRDTPALGDTLVEFRGVPEMECSLNALSLEMPVAPDKDSQGHGYLAHYEAHFARLRHDPIKLLEIGVWQGNSLILWSQYFDHAQIHGADIDLSRCVQPMPERVRLWEVDQSITHSLINMAKNLGPWDIVIDDGSHDARHQVTTFRALWPYVEPGGFYCVEDLHVNYLPGYTADMVTLLGGELQADLHAHGKLSRARVANCPIMEQEKLTPMEREIEEIHLYRHLAILQKTA